jgi:predicted glycoside hydrolase/deacetylase ChbG (UPF0249 family)
MKIKNPDNQGKRSKRIMNATLDKLGFAPTDRVAVIHADDVGMCQASLSAFVDLLEVGLVSSGSTMVPCPWFPATAAFCRDNLEVDMGVHITLTCEWDNYRWGPLSTSDQKSGLLDEEGYFPHGTRAVWEKANVEAALKETEAQVDRALSAGIDVTHMEDHMAALIHPRLLPRFVDLGLRRRIPLRYNRPPDPSSKDSEWEKVTYQSLSRLEANGSALFDFNGGLPLEDSNNHVGRVKAWVSRLPVGGLSLLVLHPAKDTPELRAIAHDWPGRVANYEALMSQELCGYVKDQGIQLIGFRILRDCLRA